MKIAPLTPETTTTMLDAAWRLMVETGQADASLTEIARAAGVSRQSLYLAFGNRAGLLAAMARRQEAASPHARRMTEIAEGPVTCPEVLLAFVEAWLAHLPGLYPVGVLLAAAAVTDDQAAQALSDGLAGGVQRKYAAILRQLAAESLLAPGWEPLQAAEFCWSLTHVDAWKHLVVERGWSEAAFLRNRQAVIRATLLAR
jgi:AcrR family transcriptional regulator